MYTIQQLLKVHQVGGVFNSLTPGALLQIEQSLNFADPLQRQFFDQLVSFTHAKRELEKTLVVLGNKHGFQDLSLL